MNRTVEPQAAETNLSDIAGWDSIMTVRLMLAVEEVVGRELTEAELEALVTVGDVERLVGGV
ncbi:MAG: acyl carrier protein [Rhizobiaceae bacterium]|nr:acyl carrier protein [Rhizobiaceae bacterium]